MSRNGKPIPFKGKLAKREPQKVMRKVRHVDGVNYPHNEARHSCASYHLAKYQDPQFTANQLGHSVKVLHSHYKGLVTRAEGEEYFKIRPR